MNKTIWLIRHGESAANAGLATPSADTIPLTEKGIKQAELFAGYFPETPSLIVVSPYLRTQETANPLKNRFKSANTEIWDIQEFTYLSQSRCGVSTILERKPLVQEFWKRSEARYCDGDGAESFSNFVGRINDTLEKLRDLEHETIAVFTHGQFIRSLMWLILTGKEEIGDREMKTIYNFMVSVPYPNTAFIKLRFIGKEIYLSPISTEHLESELISF